MNTGKRIKERRKAIGLSADKLGEMIGKNRATVYRYESGDIENFPLTVIEPLADALMTSPAYLMGWTDDPLAQYETPVQSNGRTDKNEELIRLFSSLPDEMQDRILALLQSLSKDRQDSPSPQETEP